MDYISLTTPGSTFKKRARSRDRKSNHGTPATGNSKLFNKHSDGKSTFMSCDAKLIPRIKQHLETCDMSKDIKVNSVVDHLIQAYPEYKRKRRNTFRLTVLRGINHVKAGDKTPTKGHDETLGSSSDQSDIASDFSINDESFDTNSANNTLREMYSKKPDIDVNKPNNLEAKSRIGTPKQNETRNVNVKKMKSVGDNLTNTNTTTKKKSKLREILPEESSVTFGSIGGYENYVPEILTLVFHLKHPEVYREMGMTPPQGILLHGPPGCGKTLLANAIAGDLKLPFFQLAATELVSGVSGESEERIRDLFDTAVASAPSIIFLDEIDAITPKRETSQRDMEKRIVTQLLVCMNKLHAKDEPDQVLVIGATNRPDSLDPALRLPGRFDKEIRMGIPNLNTRIRILQVLCRKLKLAATVDFKEVAQETPGYVGADLMALSREATLCAIKRIFGPLNTDTAVKPIQADGIVPDVENSEPKVLSWPIGQLPLTKEQMQDFFVEMGDFKKALKIVQPSAKREGFATIPDVTWDDVGALREVREELQLSILSPIRYREEFESLGLTKPVGILLYGPPGCGKTLIAKAIANESGINFISVKGPELLNMYLGESERAVRQCFQRAQNSSPCVIFFDELDALCPRRSDTAESGPTSRVVNQLLTEMDGLNGRKDVFILGATNRPDILDPAVLRPGRFDKKLFVNMPLPEERVDILNTLTKCGTKPCLSPDVSLKSIGLDPRCNGFTGADLGALIQEASVAALQEYLSNRSSVDSVGKSIQVNQSNFEKAFEKVILSVSPKDQRRYEAMRQTYSNTCRSNSKAVVPMDIVEQSSTDCMDLNDNGIDLS